MYRSTLSIVLLCLGICHGSAGAAEPGLFLLTIEQLKDADTAHGDVHLPWGVSLVSRDIRFLGCDAWETSKRRKTVPPVTDEEVVKGKAARTALQLLVDKAEAVYIQPDADPDQWFDPYGRVLGRIFLDLPDQAELLDVAKWVVENGHQRGSE